MNLYGTRSTDFSKININKIMDKDMKLTPCTCLPKITPDYTLRKDKAVYYPGIWCKFW